jgi:hypothetical protein
MATGLPAARVRSLRFRQVITILLLFSGYAALYFCRADIWGGTA